jgi:hypothetical protein
MNVQKESNGKIVGVTDFPIDSQIIITMNENVAIVEGNMNGGMLNDSTINWIDIGFTWSGKTVVITPVKPLEYNKGFCFQFRVTSAISNDIVGVNGDFQTNQ